MRIKSLLLALTAVLFVLAGCKNNNEAKDPKGDDQPATVNEFIQNLTQLEGYLGMANADVVAALQSAGLKSAEESEGKINATDTVSNVVCTISTTSGSTGKVNYITCEFSTTETKSYVDDATKLGDAVKSIGENHNLPSGNALAFNDFSYTKEGEEPVAGYDWSSMVQGLSDLGSTKNAVFNWKNSGSTYGRLSMVRSVTETGTTVKYILQDYSYN